MQLATFKPTIAVIVETWLKSYHTLGFDIQGYTLHRRDRIKRRGGGVAIYCLNEVQSSLYKPTVPQEEAFEILWVQYKYNNQNYIIGGIYHPPKPIYVTSDLMRYISKVVDEIYEHPDKPLLILAGDFNLLPLNAIPTLGLIEAFAGPTHQGHSLDRIYASFPLLKNFYTVPSLIKTKHSTVVASSTNIQLTERTENDTKRRFRLRTPAILAAIQLHISEIDWITELQHSTIDVSFDRFYNILSDVTNRFAPFKTVSLGKRAPKYLTPYLKNLIRKRNTLLHRRKFEPAAAISVRIANQIARANSASFDGLQRGTRALWDEVHRIEGINKGVDFSVKGINCSTLNEHYRSVSTDPSYIEPAPKMTAQLETPDDFTEYEVFNHLSKIKGNSIGPDGIPEWLISSMAHLLAQPIAYLFSKSVYHSFVPPQWLRSCITPIPKLPQPCQLSDFRPISITPILSRILEKLIVRRYLYPILTDPALNAAFSDQYAFRPTGSTTAALIALTHQLIDMLQTEPYVRLISMDFSRAFDTVRHSCLAETLAELPIPDFIYNWVIALLKNRSHCTKFLGKISEFQPISASIIQGSGLGPSNFITLISHLKALNRLNRLLKFADDSYLLIPASNASTAPSELSGVESWATACNLKLNLTKTKEMIVTLARSGKIPYPPEIPGVIRVRELKILGVVVSDKLSFDSHINLVCTRARQSFYAIRLLRAHGLVGVRLHDVVRATTLARLSYASPAWYGFANAAHRDRIESIISKLIRYGFLPKDQSPFDTLVNNADQTLFNSVIHNPGHVLHDLLPPIKTTQYSLRPRHHNRWIPSANSTQRRDFIIRMLYS